MTTKKQIDAWMAEFLDMVEEKRELEAKLRKVKDRIAELGGEDGDLTNHFVREGIQNMTLTRGRTIYVNRLVVASVKVERPEACKLIMQFGPLKHLVRYDYHKGSLDAAIREMDEADQELPDAWAEKIGLYTKTTLKSRKAGKSRRR